MAVHRQEFWADDPEPEQATVIAHDPSWRKPVIPVSMGVSGWDFIQDGTFHRWCAMPGAVVLYVWDRSEEEMLAEARDDFDGDDAGYNMVVSGESIPPCQVMEVRLPVAENTELLLRLLANGGGTLAVLEFRGGADEPPVWGAMRLHALRLERIIRAALETESIHRSDNFVVEAVR